MQNLYMLVLVALCIVAVVGQFGGFYGGGMHRPYGGYGPYGGRPYGGGYGGMHHYGGMRPYGGGFGRPFFG